MRAWCERQIDLCLATLVFVGYCIARQHEMRDEITMEVAVRVVRRLRERLETGGWLWNEQPDGTLRSPLDGDDYGSPHAPPAPECNVCRQPGAGHKATCPTFASAAE